MMSLNSDTNSEVTRRPIRPPKSEKDLRDFLKQFGLKSDLAKDSTTDDYSDSDEFDYPSANFSVLNSTKHMDIEELITSSNSKSSFSKLKRHKEKVSLPSPESEKVSTFISQYFQNQARSSRLSKKINLQRGENGKILKLPTKARKDLWRIVNNESINSADHHQLKEKCLSRGLIPSKPLSAVDDEMMETINRISKAYLNLKQRNSELVDLVESLQAKNSALQQMIIQIGSDRRRSKQDTSLRFKRRRSDLEAVPKSGIQNGVLSDETDIESNESLPGFGLSGKEIFCNQNSFLQQYSNHSTHQESTSHLTDQSHPPLSLSPNQILNGSLPGESIANEKETSDSTLKPQQNVEPASARQEEGNDSGLTDSTPKPEISSFKLAKDIDDNLTSLEQSKDESLNGSKISKLPISHFTEGSMSLEEKIKFGIEDASDVSDDSDGNYETFQRDIEANKNGNEKSPGGQTYYYDRRNSKHQINFRNKNRNRRRRGGKKSKRFSTSGWARTKNGNAFFYPEPKEDSATRSRASRQRRSPWGRRSSPSSDRESRRRRRSSRSSSYESRKKSYTRSRSRSSARTEISKCSTSDHNQSKSESTLTNGDQKRGTFVPINGSITECGVINNSQDSESRKPFTFQLIPDASKTKKLNSRTSKSSSPQLVEPTKKNVENSNNQESASGGINQETETEGGKDKVDLKEMLEAAQKHIRSRLMDLSVSKPDEKSNYQVGENTLHFKSQDGHTEIRNERAKFKHDGVAARENLEYDGQEEDPSDLLMLAINPEDLSEFGYRG